MIADDEIETRDNMIACVDWKRYDIDVVGVADNGLSALEIIAAQKPDLALVDIRMPGMSGLELIRRAREMRLSTVFIILSGYDNFQYAQQAVDYQVSKYLLKPFSIDELTDALKKAISTVHSSRSAERASGFMSALPLGGDGASSSALQYSVALEQKIVDSIARGDRDELALQIRVFMVDLRENNPTASDRFHCAMLLYSAVCRMLLQRGQPLSINHFADQNWTGSDFDEALEKCISDACMEALDTFQMTGKHNQLIQMTVAYINKHYSEKLALNVIAEHIHVSPVYLSNLFTKVVGKTITDYLQNLRVEHAKALLARPELSIGEIAEKVGYSDAKYFVRVFKRMTGITPNTFRRQSSLNARGR